MNIRNTATLLSVAMLGFTLTAGAATVTYTDLPSWQAGVSSTTNIDFSGPTPTPGNADNYNTSSGVVIAGVRFVGLIPNNGFSLAIVNANASQSYYDWGSGAVLRNDFYSSGAPTSIHATLPGTGSTAVGFDLMTGSTNGATFTIRVNGTTDYLAPTFANPTRAFFGIRSDVPITSIDFLNPVNTYAMVDNFKFGTATAPASETPEAATMVLCATGLVMIARKWKKRSACLTLAAA